MASPCHRPPVTESSLIKQLRPAGPVVDAAAAKRAREALGDLPGWPALEPVF